MSKGETSKVRSNCPKGPPRIKLLDARKKIRPRLTWWDRIDIPDITNSALTALSYGTVKLPITIPAEHTFD